MKNLYLTLILITVFASFAEAQTVASTVSSADGDNANIVITNPNAATLTPDEHRGTIWLDNDGKFKFRNVTAYGWAFRNPSNTTDLITIGGNGYMSIGTATPSTDSWLAVQDQVKIVTSNGWGGFYASDSPTGGNTIFSLTRQGNDLGVNAFDNIGFKAGAQSGQSTAYQMFIKSDGKVGIGTTSPYAPLQIQRTANSYTTNEMLRLFNDYNPSSTNTPSILFTNSSSPDPFTTTDQTWGLAATVAGTGGFGVYYKNGTNALSTPFFINQANNVGIGTISPGNKLDVAGSAIINPTGTYGSFTEGLRINNAPNNYAIVHLGGASGSVNNTGPGQWDVLKDAANNFGILDNANNRFSIDGSGNIGIGTTTPGSYKLAVNGLIHTKGVVVDVNGFPDYVFTPRYNLKPLSEVKAYIDQNHHLPEIPSANEVAKNGLDLGEMNKLLTKKVEELTLYLIEKDQIQKTQEERIKKLEAQMAKLIKE